MELQMEKITVKGLREKFRSSCLLMRLDPAKDTLESVVEKFNEAGARHLVLFTENGGLLCLCSDPEMSRRVYEAVTSSPP